MSPMSKKRDKVERVYTPPPRSPQLRYRPPWHRLFGAVVLSAGLAMVLVNIIIEFTDQGWLPGGHNPGYLILGIVIAVSSMWWFGWFDRRQ